MKLKFDTTLDFFIIFIVIIKIIFILSAITTTILHFSMTHNNSNVNIKNKINNNMLIIKEKTEFVFIISMSLLLLYYFNPRSSPKPHITEESSILFFLFGCILIITAKWSLLLPR